MTFDEFIKEWDGKILDYDKTYGGQCVDVYRQYCKDVLGVPQSPPVAGAKDIWDTYLKEQFSRIDNTPSGVPRKGDIVIWGEGIGKFGHVAIFIEGNTKSFKSFDENFPVGSKCHIQDHTYKAVLGWLVPKSVVVEPPINQDEINQLKQQVISANEALADRAREVSMLTEDNQRLSNRVDEAEGQLDTTRSERDTAIWEAEKLQIQVKTLQEEVDGLQKQVDAYKKDNLKGLTFIQRVKLLFG